MAECGQAGICSRHQSFFLAFGLAQIAKWNASAPTGGKRAGAKASGSFAASEPRLGTVPPHERAGMAVQITISALKEWVLRIG